MQGGQTTRATTVAGMLWALVALLLAHFAQTFGHVCALDAHARRQAGLWLRDVEALSRRLLFAQAA